MVSKGRNPDQEQAGSVLCPDKEGYGPRVNNSKEPELRALLVSVCSDTLRGGRRGRVGRVLLRRNGGSARSKLPGGEDGEDGEDGRVRFE